MGIKSRENFFSKKLFFFKKTLDKTKKLWYNIKAVGQTETFSAVEIDGGIAQLARALGSYPGGRRFKSTCRYHQWRVGQVVKTPPFHGGIMGSNPVRVTEVPECQKMAFRIFLYSNIDKRLSFEN